MALKFNLEFHSRHSRNRLLLPPPPCCRHGQLTLIAYNHHQKIMKIDTVRAYYFGTRLLVEIDVVLPELMPLREAHNIGESLQVAVESLDFVERVRPWVTGSGKFKSC